MSASDVSLAVNRFVAAAAETYRQAGIEQAREVARLLDEHAGARFAISAASRPATAHLGAVRDAADLHPVARELGPALASLDWTEGTLPVPTSFKGRYAYVTLIGEGTSRPDDRLYFGLYLQVPQTYYPSHWHRAEELYVVLSGTALWQQGTTKLTPKPPGTLVHHAPDEPHVMQTEVAPLLAMWAWIGDLSDSYQIADA